MCCCWRLVDDVDGLDICHLPPVGATSKDVECRHFECARKKTLNGDDTYQALAYGTVEASSPHVFRMHWDDESCQQVVSVTVDVFGI